MFSGEYEIIDDIIELINKLNDQNNSNLLKEFSFGFSPSLISGKITISKIENTDRTRLEMINTKDLELFGGANYTYVEFVNGVYTLRGVYSKLRYSVNRFFIR